MNGYQQRTGSVGCLGVFSVFCLSIFSICELGLLLRLDPAWLDRHAFWRPPLVENTQLVSTEEARALGFTDWDIKLPPVPKPRNDEPVPFAFLQSSAPYDTSRGGQVQLENGASVTLPAGSVRENCEVSMAPVASLPDTMLFSQAGDAYEIRIGNNEHYQFARPIRVSLPYNKSVTDAVVAVWEGDSSNGKWRELPSRMDASSGLVSADLPHASIIAAIARVGGTSYGIFHAVFLSSTGRQMQYRIRNITASTLDTDHFKIWYVNAADDATHGVPADSAYQGSRPPGMKATSGKHPLYVQDIGQLLEEVRDELRAMKHPAAPSGMTKWDVFVQRLGSAETAGNVTAGDAGETNTKGPMFLSNRFLMMAAPSFTPEMAMRATVAHEMTHLAQDAWLNFGAASSHYHKHMLETTAAYMGDAVWERKGNPANMVKYFYSLKPNLPAYSLDDAPDPVHYNYADFLRYLDTAISGSGLGLVEHCAQSGDLTVKSIDEYFRSPAGQSSATLAKSFTEFAQDYYYNDLWRQQPRYKQNKDVPRDLRTLLQLSGVAATENEQADGNFTLVASARNSVGAQIINIAATRQLASMPYLTAHLRSMIAGKLPKERKAKLVVAIDTLADPSSLIQFYVAKNAVPALAGNNTVTIPLSGSPTSLDVLEIQHPRTSFVIKNFGNPDECNMVSVMAVNTSLQFAKPGFNISRWLLLAPSFITIDRRDVLPNSSGSRTWSMTWHESELKAAGRSLPDGKPIFKGYAVYRKPAGASNDEFAKVKEDIQTESFSDQAPDDRRYDYTVRVVDCLGNESENAPFEADYFVGTWEGEIQLVDGEFAKPILAFVAERRRLAEQKESARISGLSSAEERARATKSFQDEKKMLDEIVKVIEDLTTGFEALARIGLPIELKIEEKGGRYQLTPTHFLFQPLKNPDSAMLRLDSPTRLQFLDIPEELPPVYLQIWRMDEVKDKFIIRQDKYTFKVPIENKNLETSWKWVLTKKKKAGAGDEE